MLATPSALTMGSVSMSVVPVTARRMPMSATSSAFLPNCADSTFGRPNSFTSSAPETLKRSVMNAFIDEFRSICLRAAFDCSVPTRLLTTKRIGTTVSDSSVTCHDRVAITTRVNATVSTSVNTVRNVDVNADWAPTTSLLSRLISEPVWVRAKKAMGSC